MSDKALNHGPINPRNFLPQFSRIHIIAGSVALSVAALAYYYGGQSGSDQAELVSLAVGDTSGNPMLTIVQQSFPNTSHHGALIMELTRVEDAIQSLNDPLRDIGMKLIQSLYDDTDPRILELQSRQSELTPEEQIKLNQLIFKKNQQDLATLLLWLQGNGILEQVIRGDNTPSEDRCIRPQIIT